MLRILKLSQIPMNYTILTSIIKHYASTRDKFLLFSTKSNWMENFELVRHKLYYSQRRGDGRGGGEVSLGMSPLQAKCIRAAIFKAQYTRICYHFTENLC